MTRQDVSASLREIGTLLELMGAEPFRVRSYQNAARTLETLDQDLQGLADAGRLTDISGVGKALAQKIDELLRTGHLEYLDALRVDVPPGLVAMLKIPNFGPKKIKLVYDAIGADTIEKLEAAAKAGELRGLKGMGEKSEAKLLDGIAHLRTHAGRFRRDEGERARAAITAALSLAPGDRLEVCGSLRRGNETIKDIDIVIGAATDEDASGYLDALCSMDDVIEVRGHGGTKASVVLRSGLGADLRVVSLEAFPFAVAYFTGSKAHNTRMRSRAQQRGWKLNEYGLFDDDESLPGETETDIYAKLDLKFVPPERREDLGEFDLYASGRDVPALVTAADLRGVVHAHTTWSDGKESLATMASEAAARGAVYLVITDHSQAAAYAGGLKPDAVHRQHDEIDAYNADAPALRVIKGIECDILVDGRLDYDDDLLATFDVVIASVHSAFHLDREAMTARIERAMRHPSVHILGHPTGRLLLTRDGYPLDEERLIEVAAETGVALEINASPHRLDLDWRTVLLARTRGVRFTIGPDAHSIADLDSIGYGISMARKGGLTADDVLNTRDADDLIRELR